MPSTNFYKNKYRPDPFASQTKNHRRRSWFSYNKVGSDPSTARSSKNKRSQEPRKKRPLSAAPSKDWLESSKRNDIYDMEGHQSQTLDARTRWAAKSSSSHPLKVIRAKVPWRSSSGKSRIIHPLMSSEFFTHVFGRQSILLQRGPRHPMPMTAQGAAALLQSYSLGLNAELLTPAYRNARPRALSPERGQPAVQALMQGKPVKLNHVEHRAPDALLNDFFIRRLERVAPGRDIGMTLNWAPPGAVAASAQVFWYDQIILQVYGSREWTICSPGYAPHLDSINAAKYGADKLQPKGSTGANDGFDRSNTRWNAHQKRTTADSQKGEQQTAQAGNCTTAILRRGDLLYLQPRTWHWTVPGQSASAHLVMGISPLVLADLVMATGARSRLLAMEMTPMLGTPLPLWRYRDADDAVNECADLCAGLPWPRGIHDSKLVCESTIIKTALVRLAGKWATAQWQQTTPLKPGTEGHFADGESEQARFARIEDLKVKHSWWNNPVTRSLANGLFFLVAILFLIWLCIGIFSEDTTTKPRRSFYEGSHRPGRTARYSRKSRFAKKTD